MILGQSIPHPTPYLYSPQNTGVQVLVTAMPAKVLLPKVTDAKNPSGRILRRSLHATSHWDHIPDEPGSIKISHSI